PIAVIDELRAELVCKAAPRAARAAERAVDGAGRHAALIDVTQAHPERGGEVPRPPRARAAAVDERHLRVAHEPEIRYGSADRQPAVAERSAQGSEVRIDRRPEDVAE